MRRLLVRGGTVVTVDAAHRVLAADVLVEDGRITRLSGRLARPDAGVEVLDATGAVVLPGFVQAHVHLCQVLMRGMADDLSLLDWLRRRIWPLEAAHDERSLTASAELGVAELIRGGTTTILDMGTVRHHDAVFEVLEATGLRALSGKTMMDAGSGLPRGLRETRSASLGESERLHRRWHGAAGGRLGYAFAPRFTLSCSDALLADVAALAAERGALVHTHAAENREERRLVRRAKGRSDVAHLERLGIAGPRAVLAHGVHLTDAEMRRMSRLGTRVAHCPSANLKLGSGIARVPEMLAAGIEVGLGADGAPCNNDLDALREARLASLLAKARVGPESLPAALALELLTIRGARVLGLDREIGSLEVGKRADLVVLRTDTVHAAPALDPVATVLYASVAADVRHVVCDGRILLRDGEHQSMDVARVVGRAGEEAKRLARRAGL